MCTARDRTVGLALYTVTDNYRDCVQRVALGRPIPLVNRKPVAKCKILITLQQLLIAKPDIRCESRFYPIPPAFDAPLTGFPSEYCHAVWYGKTRMVGLPKVKKIEDMTIRFYMIHERDRQTDRQTPPDGKPRV